jgi:hypothetical protein
MPQLWLRSLLSRRLSPLRLLWMPGVELGTLQPRPACWLGHRARTHLCS